MGYFAPLVVALLALLWVTRDPKFHWQPAEPLKQYPTCPSSTTEKLVIVGGTSLLGRYIVAAWKEHEPKVCVINYGRKPCKQCDVSIIGDLRDTKHVERMLKKYAPETVVTSIKPELTGRHYREYIEVNVAAMMDLTRLCKENGVKNFVHVSSIAASSHYLAHRGAKESDPQPYYSQYEAHYDISKRLGEDYVLLNHEEGKFNTIALRVSGIVGGNGDPFFHHRLPIIASFDSPILIDYGFAGNIALALVEVARGLKKNPALGGEFYYYTGEAIHENVTAVAISEHSGRPLIKLPYWVLCSAADFWQWLRWDHNTYTIMDLLRCGNIDQVFDQTKFHKAFPNFKPKYTLLEALEYVYKGKGELTQL